MNKEAEVPKSELDADAFGTPINLSGTVAATKQIFVEPEISVPVDVLEATTFFQGITSGVTLP